MDRHDRRTFLRKSAQGIAAASTIGVGGTLLDACGGSTPTSKGNGGGGGSTKKGPSGVTDHKAPKRGGSLVVGTWSEVNGLSPPTATWDATGYLYGNAIFDTLVQIGADGQPHPYLAHTITHNADHTVWTFSLRPNITFHSGEPMNAKAVVGSLEAVKSGLVTSQTLKPVVSIVAKGELDVVVTVDQPWPAFPTYLAGQIGYICSPKMLASKNSGATQPIGTGPFLFEQWIPNNHLTLKKNPHYWQKGFPYLDNLTFRPILDNSTRADALLSGTIQLMHCQAPQSIKPFFGNSKFQVILPDMPKNGEPDADFIMLNCAEAPMNDLNIRKALAMSINKGLLRETYGQDLTTPLNGPFVPGEIWYTPTGYPQYDPTAAAKLVSDYKSSHGGQPPKITLTTIQGPDYLELANLVQSGWTNAGFDVTVGQVEFAQFVVDAVLGKFQACTFEQFAASDPDQNYIWWSNETIGKVGAVSLNMARNSDPRIQKALTTGRQSTDLATRATAYKEVSKYLAEDLPYLWLGETYWSAICADDVVGVTGQTLPDGSKSVGFNGGSMLVHELALTN